MEKNLCAIILAGGEGKRMKSDRPKALSQVLFQPMLQWVIDAVKIAGISDICVVTGYKKEYIEEYASKLDFEIKTVYQSERLGTGHAVMTAKEFIKQHSNGNVLVLNGDAPFMDGETIRSAAEFHCKDAFTGCTVISAEIENPTGYGRIVRETDKNGNTTNILKAIVEEKEADSTQRKIKEINSGAFWFNAWSLLDALDKIVPSAKTGEYYLTDTVEIIRAAGKNVHAFKTENSNAVLGANDCLQLNLLNEIARRHILEEHMKNGVCIPCMDGVVIGKNVRIGKNTTILPSSILRGNTVIGNSCEIGPAVLLDGCTVSDEKKLSCGTFEYEAL